MSRARAVHEFFRLTYNRGDVSRVGVGDHGWDIGQQLLHFPVLEEPHTLWYPPRSYSTASEAGGPAAVDPESAPTLAGCGQGLCHPATPPHILLLDKLGAASLDHFGAL